MAGHETGETAVGGNPQLPGAIRGTRSHDPRRAAVLLSKGVPVILGDADETIVASKPRASIVRRLHHRDGAEILNLRDLAWRELVKRRLCPDPDIGFAIFVDGADHIA